VSLNDVRELKISLCKDCFPSHRIKATQKNFLTQHAQFHQLIEMETAFNRFQFTTLFSLGYLATICLQIKAWTICELKDLQNVISDKWHDVAIRQPASKKPYSSGKHVCKREWRTYSALFLMISYWWFGLLWRFGIACVRAETQMMNRLQKLFHGV